MIRKYSRHLLLMGLVMIATLLSAQQSKIDSLQAQLSNVDEARQVDLLHELVLLYINTAPDTALALARQAFQISADLNDIERHSRSFRRWGYASYASRNMDMMRTSLLDYITYARQTNQPDQVAASYRNLSKIGESTKQPDSSLHYLAKCLEVLEQHPDSVIMVDVYLSQGLSYKYKGFYETSLASLLQGLRISESLHKPYKLGYLNMNLAITSYMMDRTEESAAYSRAAIEYFKNDDNQRAVNRTTNNLAIALSDLGKNEDAKTAFAEVLDLSVPTKMPNIAMHAHNGLADIFFEEGNFQEAAKHTNQSEQIGREIDNQFNDGSVARFRSKMAIAQGDMDRARREMLKAQNFFDSHREPIEESEIYFEMAEIYEDLGMTPEALDFLKKGHTLEDSLYTIKKEQQFEELKLTYETEKKDAEIHLLQKDVELSHARQQRLWGGIGLVALLGLSIIVNQWRVRKREKIISERERDIEIEKRKRAEQELEFKKKELTAKALQLAGKNKFLQSLEGEIDKLKSSVDQTVKKTSQRLSRMIHHDALDDAEWDHFGKEFSSVHQEFMDTLQAEHGSFTNSEWRLIALLKMNLSSKDIANILRITGDGVKKARYRLRKKLQLDSKIDIQEYLLGL